MILDLRRKVSPRTWEAALFQYPYTAKDDWSPRLKKEGLVVDLSKVGWVEPGTLVRIALLIEGALLGDSHVTVRMPFAGPTRAEGAVLGSSEASSDPALRAKATYIAAYVERRRHAAAVIGQMRFREALQHVHLRPSASLLAIDDNYDWSISGNEGVSEDRADPSSMSTMEPLEAGSNSAMEPLERGSVFKVVYGMQWIEDPSRAGGQAAIERLAAVDVLADVLTHPSRRVSTADGRTLAHVFLNELVENATKHGGRSYALVAAWNRPRGVVLKPDEVFACEHEFAEWSQNYPILEVIVGDSGVGIPATLGDEFRRRQPSTPQSLKDRTENDRILAWAFDKWSSQHSAPGRRGTRGLYRVERIVRKYDGCITIRSEASCVGVDSGSRDLSTTIVEELRLARSPGTIVQVRIPVMLADLIPPRRNARALGTTRFQVVDLHRVDWSAPAAVEAACASLRDICQEESPSGESVCVVVDCGFATLGRHALGYLLRETVDIAHPVALVIANVGAPSWDACAELIDALMDDEGASGVVEDTAEIANAVHVRDPVLFIHADGRAAWVGVRAEIAELFQRLWDKGELEAAELTAIFPDRERRSWALRQLYEAYHVARRREAGGLALRFNVADVQQSLERRFLDKLLRAIQDAASTDVVRGVCRTPSLELVSRFIDVERLLVRLGLESALSRLAQKCLAREGMLDSRRAIEIVADWRTNRFVLETFRRCLGAVSQHSLSVEINQCGANEPVTFREDSVVVVFSDLILTGNTVGSLLAQIVRSERTPAIVAAIVDARHVRTTSMTAMGHAAEVVALAEIDMLLEDGDLFRDAINISPLTQKPEGVPAQRNYEIPSERLVEMIETQGALYFRHVVRPNGRHFCFYLDAFELLGARDTADEADMSASGREIIATFRRAIDHALSPDQKVEVICLPQLIRSERPSPAALIGGVLAQNYRAELLPVGARGGDGAVVRSWGTQGVVDDSSIGQLALFDSIARETPRVFVVVDWGSLSGRSVLELIRAAAQNGATTVIAVVLLSQLDRKEEDSLVGLKVVEAYGPNGAARECRVTVKFLARFPIVAYDARNCPNCRQLYRLDSEERFYPSSLLRRYVEGARERLRRRALADLREERVSNRQKRADLDEDALGERGSAQVAILRAQFESARESTSERLRLYRVLFELANMSPEDAVAMKPTRGRLMRVLAAEWTWLKQEPFTLIRFRREISRLAVQVVCDASRPEAERADAIVVLRTASKEAFAQNLPELFEVVVDNELLVSQLLYCAFTYLLRDYVMVGALQPLSESLLKCSQHLSPLLELPTPRIALQVGQTVSALHQYARYLLHRRAELSAEEAWRQLQEHFGPGYHVHHPVCVAFDNLRFGPLENEIGDPATPIPVIHWRDLLEGWERKCEPFLIESILPLLPPLRGVFEGIDVRTLVGTPAAESLALFGEGKGFATLSALSQQLKLFVSSPEHVRQPTEWTSYAEARNWIWDLFVDPGEFDRNGHRRRGCALVRLLEGCPTNLRNALDEVSTGDALPKRVEVTIVAGRSPAVFCHADVVRECIKEVIRNAERHTDPSEEKIRVECVIGDHGNGVSLRMRNTGKPRRSEKAGRGLATCAERLQPYGASLERELNPGTPWTFGVKMAFRLG